MNLLGRRSKDPRQSFAHAQFQSSRVASASAFGSASPSGSAPEEDIYGNGEGLLSAAGEEKSWFAEIALGRRNSLTTTASGAGLPKSPSNQRRRRQSFFASPTHRDKAGGTRALTVRRSLFGKNSSNSTGVEEKDAWELSSQGAQQHHQPDSPQQQCHRQSLKLQSRTTENKDFPSTNMSTTSPPRKLLPQPSGRVLGLLPQPSGRGFGIDCERAAMSTTISPPRKSLLAAPSGRFDVQSHADEDIADCESSILQFSTSNLLLGDDGHATTIMEQDEEDCQSFIAPTVATEQFDELLRYKKETVQMNSDDSHVKETSVTMEDRQHRRVTRRASTGGRLARAQRRASAGHVHVLPNSTGSDCITSHGNSTNRDLFGTSSHHQRDIRQQRRSPLASGSSVASTIGAMMATPDTSIIVSPTPLRIRRRQQLAEWNRVHHHVSLDDVSTCSSDAESSEMPTKGRQEDAWTVSGTHQPPLRVDDSPGHGDGNEGLKETIHMDGMSSTNGFDDLCFGVTDGEDILSMACCSIVPQTGTGTADAAATTVPPPRFLPTSLSEHLELTLKQ